MNLRTETHGKRLEDRPLDGTRSIANKRKFLMNARLTIGTDLHLHSPVVNELVVALDEQIKRGRLEEIVD